MSVKRWWALPAALALVLASAGPAYAGSISDATLSVSTSVSTVESGNGLDVTVAYTNNTGSTVTPAAVITLPAGTQGVVWDLANGDCTGGSFTSCSVSGDNFLVVWGSGIAASATATTVAHLDTISGADDTLTFGADWYPDVNGQTHTTLGSTFDVEVYTTNDTSVALIAQADLISVPHEVDYVLTLTNLAGGPMAGTVTTVLPSQLASASVVTGSGCSTVGLTITCTFSNLTTTQQWSFSGPANLLATGTGTATSTLSATTPSDDIASNDVGSAACTFVTSAVISC